MQAEGRQDQLQAAEHRPPTDLDQRAERKLQPAARLAARGVNDTQFAVGQEEAGRHAGFAQQPLQLLVRCRLPAFERAALVRDRRRALDPNEDLPALIGVGHRPMWRKLCVALLDADGQVRRQCRPTGTPATCAARQPRICVKNAQGSGNAGPWSVIRKERTHRFAVGARLFRRVQSVAGKHGRGDHKSDRLNIANPFGVGIDRSHYQLLSGQR